MSRAASTQALSARSAFTGNEESTVSPQAPAAAHGQREPGPVASEQETQGAWGATPPGAALGAGPQLQRSRLSQGSQEAAHKVFCRPGKEKSALFLEKKEIPCFFLQKYLFLSEFEFGAMSF